MANKEISELKAEIEKIKMQNLIEQVQNPNLSPVQKENLIKQFELGYGQEIKTIRMKVIPHDIMDFNGLDLQPELYSKDAFVEVTLHKLTKVLEEQDFILSQINIPDESFPSYYTEEEKSKMQKKINQIRSDLAENHYSILYLGLCFFAIVDEVVSQSDNYKLLMMRNTIAAIIIEYNKDFSIRQEFNNLGMVNTLDSLISEFIAYLSSAEYIQSQKSLIYSQDRYITAFAGFSNRIKKNNKDVNVIKISDLDLKKEGTMENKLVIIQQFLKIVKADSDEIFNRMREENIDIFNLKINEGIANQQMIHLIKNSKFLKDFYNKAEILQSKPYFFLLNTYKLYIFPEKYSLDLSLGDNLGTFTLTPGEIRELKVKTVESTKELRNESTTIFDSMTTEAQQDLSDCLEGESSSKSSLKKELEWYLDSELRTKFEADLKVKLFGNNTNVKSESGFNLDSGISENIKSEREDSAKSVHKAVAKHMNKQVGKKDITITYSTQTSTEKTKEETSIINIKNPNRYSCLNIRFRQLIDNYLTFVVLDDMYLLFSNGVTYEKVHISNADKLINKYIKMPEDRVKFKDFIIRCGEAKDYCGRKLKFINNNLETATSKGFFDILRDSNQLMNSTDYMFQEYLSFVRGIPLSYDRTTVPTSNMVAEACEDKVVLNELERSEAEAQVKMQMAESNLKEKRVEKENCLINSMDIMIKKLVEMDPKDAAYSYFLVFSDSKSMFDKTQALTITGDTFKKYSI